jgi:hypothetical protein
MLFDLDDQRSQLLARIIEPASKLDILLVNRCG